jgi:hypothetical protein
VHHPLLAFFSFFAARFSSKVFAGFFLPSFFRSMLLAMTRSFALVKVIHPVGVSGE